MADIQWKTSVDKVDGLTRVMGSLRLEDGREIAAYEEVHGRFRVMIAPYAYEWVEYPGYQSLIDMAKQKIKALINELAEKESK